MGREVCRFFIQSKNHLGKRGCREGMSFLFESVNREGSLLDPCSKASVPSSFSDHPIALQQLRQNACQGRWPREVLFEREQIS